MATDADDAMFFASSATYQLALLTAIIMKL
jgi:hypothetical protein